MFDPSAGSVFVLIDHSDESIAEDLRDGTSDRDEAISIILSSTIFRALAYFDFALATGDAQWREMASVLLGQALALARDGNAVPLWWITRVAASLIDDLWTNSLHNTVPREAPQGSENYPVLQLATGNCTLCVLVVRAEVP